MKGDEILRVSVKKIFVWSYKYFLLKLLTQPKRKSYTSLKFSFWHKENGIKKWTKISPFWNLEFARKSLS